MSQQIHTGFLAQRFDPFESLRCHNRKVNGASGKTHVVPIYRSSSNFQPRGVPVCDATMAPLSSPKTGRESRHGENRIWRNRPFEAAACDRWSDYWERNIESGEIGARIHLDRCCIYQPRSVVTLRVRQTPTPSFDNEPISLNFSPSFKARLYQLFYQILELYIKRLVSTKVVANDHVNGETLIHDLPFILIYQ